MRVQLGHLLALTVSGVLAADENRFLASETVGSPPPARLPGLSTRLCKASDIGLTLGMHSNSQDAEVIGRGLRIGDCAHLDLSNTPIGVEGALALGHAFRLSTSWRKNLTHLNLTNSAIGSGHVHLLSQLAETRQLRSLDLSGNWLGDDSIVRIFRLMRKAKFLQVLRLRWNGITERYAARIATAMRSASRLFELDLGGNWLKSTGVTRISRGLNGHPSLRRVRLDHNAIDTEGMKVLAKALLNNSVLEYLDLGGNEIDDVGAKELARVLASSSSSLRRVSLRLNERITDYGANSIAGALREHGLRGKNSGPTHLDLGGNRISNAGASSLADAAATNGAILELKLWDNSPERRQGWAHTKLWGNVTRPLQAMLAARVAKLGRVPRVRKAGEANLHLRQHEYWRQVYPLASEELIASAVANYQLVYKTAPHTLLGSSCRQQPWRICRLDAYFRYGQTPPKIDRGAMFAPFRLPPGTCMRNLFGWKDLGSRAAWEASYPFATGAPDNSWSEIAHTRDQSGGAWMYLAKGSGIFWNCGTSLRAKNKVAAAIRLTEQLAPLMSREKVRATPAETLAHAIESNDPSACDDDHCQIFMQMLASNRTDRNDNCFGKCRLAEAPLAVWLQRAASGADLANWEWDHMAASSVFDQIIWQWAKRVGYDSVQLTMQPQVWCGLTWTTEVLDLRVRRHRPHDLIKHLSLRNPLALAASMGKPASAPCVVRQDNTSWRAFNLMMYCEGNVMERSARCLSDAATGKALRKFTIYSQYSHHRFDACTRVQPRLLGTYTQGEFHLLSLLTERTGE